ncbi:MAG: TetR/AcrR family transcriptional regulator [Rhodospirillales bacterium]
MPRSGDVTRSNILDAAQHQILQHGFAGASVDRIINAAHITKGGFFHHFKSKGALAEALVNRFVEQDAQLLATVCKRAERLSDDPLQRVLNIIGLYADALDDHPDVIEGCLYASFALQRKEYPLEVARATAAGIAHVYDVLGPYYQAALDAYPVKKPLGCDDLISLFVSIGEGALIIAAINQDPKVPGQQFRLHKTHVELLFGR